MQLTIMQLTILINLSIHITVKICDVAHEVSAAREPIGVAEKR